MTIKFSNNAISTLASGINNSATSITLASGDGAKFPSLTGSEYFRATLIDASNNLEIVKVTARSSDVLTVTRAQESTTARAFATGDRIELRITAQSLLDAATTLTSLAADLGLNSNDITGSGNITHTGNITTTGNGSFSGDLTVDTSTLKVDSSNNRVGIGTASPAQSLHVVATDARVRTEESGGSTTFEMVNTSSGHFLDSSGTNDLTINKIGSANIKFKLNNAEEFRMEADGDFHADGDVIAFSTTVSDIALKSDIQMIPNALDKIDEVRGVTFTRHNGKKSAGIIAQELEKVLPEAVREKKLALLDGKEYKTVEYDAIHGLLINCIKELKEKVRKLENGSTK